MTKINNVLMKPVDPTVQTPLNNTKPSALNNHKNIDSYSFNGDSGPKVKMQKNSFGGNLLSGAIVGSTLGTYGPGPFIFPWMYNPWMYSPWMYNPFSYGYGYSYPFYGGYGGYGRYGWC